MRKTVFILLSIFLSQLSFAKERVSNVQTDPYVLKWGVQLGVDMNQLTGKDIAYIYASEKTTYKPGFHLGFFLKNPVGKHFRFGHELNYTWKAYGVQLSDSLQELYKTKLVTHIIELAPLNITYHTKGWELYAGPYLNGIVAAHHKVINSDGKKIKDKSVYGKPETDESEDKYMSRIDFGIVTGMNYQFKSNVLIGFRFSQALIDNYQYAHSYEFGDTRNRIKIRNRGFRLSIGYQF